MRYVCPHYASAFIEVCRCQAQEHLRHRRLSLFAIRRHAAMRLMRRATRLWRRYVDMLTARYASSVQRSAGVRRVRAMRSMCGMRAARAFILLIAER